ncbi:hypothetical protein N9K91_00970 [Schleiferiaceae bacterium]|nr:hypothetical protein [Schleiferiaceae bacterium]
MQKQKHSVFWWPMWITVAVLLVVFLASLLSDQVTWSIYDFLIGGGLIFVFATIETILWNKLKSKHRLFVVLFVLLVFLILWAEMAVGLFDSPLGGS